MKSPAAIARIRDKVRSTTDTVTGRLVVFGAIGLSGFIPNLAVVYVLCRYFGMNYIPATVLATQVAIAWNFLLLEKIVYARSRQGPWYTRITSFLLLNNSDLLVRIPLLAALVNEAHVNYLLATAVTLVALCLIRFAVTDRLIYRLRSRTSVLGAAPLPTLPLPATGD